jgi:GT2 family glycosyltransferase
VSGTPAHYPTVTCVLLNWNGWRDTLACLRALAGSDYPNMSLLVIDNGSTDGSVERIRRAHPDVELIENGSNLGFGSGVNVGLRRALERGVDYVWLLNNDTEPHPQALTEMVKKACSNPALGAVGSVMRYLHDPQKIQAWGGGQVSHWVGRSIHAVAPEADGWFDYITAASVLLSRRALQDVGLFDEGFFLYWEDVDLAFRLRARGWQLGVAADSSVLHKENASTGGNRNVVARHSTASGIRFLSKYSPLPWLSIPLFICMRAVRRLSIGQVRDIGSVTAGVRDYLRSDRRRRDERGTPSTQAAEPPRHTMTERE